jgi:glycosyltransferase involved in cell wall biosynthesis
LIQAVRSALAQTYANLEVVVSDNCSTDSTPSLMQSIESPRLRYVRHASNLGANGNFNACLDAARGEYFLLLHDDDLIDPNFVSSCLAAIPETESVGLVRTGMRIIDDSGDTVRTLRNSSHATTLREFVSDWFHAVTSPYCCNTIMNTEALRSAGGFNSRHNVFQDVLAQVKVAATHGCTNVADVRASFRQHDGNMGSAALLRNWCEDSLELLDVISAFVQDPELSATGKRFFCRLNYRQAAALRTHWQRFSGYRLVSQYFDASESAASFAWRRDIRPRLRALKRRAMRRPVPAPDTRAR